MNKTETDRIVVNVLKVCSGMTQLDTIKKTLQLSEEKHQREINTFEALKRNNESWKEDFKKLYDILNEQHQKQVEYLKEKIKDNWHIMTYKMFIKEIDEAFEDVTEQGGLDERN